MRDVIMQLPYSQPSRFISLYDSDLPLDIRVATLADKAEVIEYLHKNGIVLGDFKPSNVLISSDENRDSVFKVTDYACPKVSRPQSSNSTT